VHDNGNRVGEGVEVLCEMGWFLVMPGGEAPVALTVGSPLAEPDIGLKEAA
jgi:hypothetical protein